ncbi:MAG: TonB-dependent receptor [Gammaproteobacteria bacterium]|nr:TonB-dependent receptor [Gammaproteobacteria bacterium]
MYTQNDEDDDKVRFTNQICQKNSIPVQGCLPDGFGFDEPHAGATTGGIFGGLNEAVLLGDPNATTAFPRPANIGIRDAHTDFEPVFDNKERTWSFGFNYNLDDYTVTLQGAVQETEYLSRQDYNVNVGFDLNATALNPTGYWPTSEPAGAAGGDWTSPDCNYLDGTSGVFGGCVYPADTTRVFAYDQASNESEYWTVEFKLQSHLDGPVNFMVGAHASSTEYFGDYYVVANTLDLVGYYGVPKLGFPPLYPTMYNNTGDPGGSNLTDTFSYFGEVYWDVQDDIKVTFGLRFNDDEKETRDSGTLYNSIDLNAIFGGAFGSPVWLRSSLAPLLNPAAIGTPAAAGAQQLAEYYGVYNDYLTTLGGGDYFGAVFALVNGVPPVPGFGETRDLTGSPSKEDWQETTGRLGIDWQVNDNSLMYATFTRGYKPGGFNPALNPSFVATNGAKYTFDPEQIDSIEIGSKNILMDGQILINSAFFIYDYEGLQVTRIANNNSLNDNIDADIMGLEVELLWQPSDMPELSVDASYSWLKAEVDGSESVDPLNRGGDEADWITLNNIDPGSLTGVNYVARESEILAGTVITDAYAACGALSAANTNLACPQVAPGTDYSNGIPAYFSRNYLISQGIETSDGQAVSLDGKELPNSPEHTLKIGVAYSISTAYGTFTPRWDYYWQADSYAREFNTLGDEIDSWDQHNLSLIWDSNDNQWQARLWVRNVQDEDNVTGKYLTSDTSGFFRNYFLTEPRIWGLSLRWQPIN